MKKIITILLAVILALSLFGCTGNQNTDLTTRDYIAMDTVFSIRAGKSPDLTGSAAIDMDSVLDGCEKLTEEIEKVLSATLPESEVYSFNSGVNALFDADPMLTEVMETAFRISSITDSAYDPTIGALTSLWNIKGGGPVPTENEIGTALAASGVKYVEIKDNAIYKSNPAVKLDFGGIGKGYATQRLAEYLFEEGVPYGIISAGRNVGVFGEKPDGSPFKIGIADPKNTEGVVGYLYTESGFISVAGDYEQYFEADGTRYHHIMDPKTGYPSDSGLSSVAVISQNGTAADALSTALMVMGYDKGMEFYHSDEMPFEAVFIFSNGAVKLTDGLDDRRFEFSSTYDPTATVIITANTNTSVSTTENTTSTEVTSAKG